MTALMTGVTQMSNASRNRHEPTRPAEPPDETDPERGMPLMPGQDGAAAGPDTASGAPGRLRAWWNAAAGALGVVAGLAPHVLHHIGLLAGTALIAGAGGTVLFGILGLALSVPMLLRLRRRYASWLAPAIGLAVFAVMFSLSAFVIGPAINGGADGQPGGGQPTPTVNHSSHHG
jgi:hypothetical protein